jgi:hypothetical protein
LDFNSVVRQVISQFPDIGQVCQIIVSKSKIKQRCHQLRDRLAKNHPEVMSDITESVLSSGYIATRVSSRQVTFRLP